MHILRAWRDSLTILLPSQVKLFALVTFLSTYKTYRILIGCVAWWILVIGMIGWGCLDRVFMQPYLCLAFNSGVACVSKKTFWDLGSFMLAVSMVLLVCAAARPSITIKDKVYFQKLIRHMSLIFMCLMLAQLIGYASMVFGGIWVSKVASTLLVSHWAQVYSVLYVFFILCMFDTDSTLAGLLLAAKRAITMIIYNLPLLSIIYLGIQMVDMGLFTLLAILGLDMNFFAWFLLWIVAMPFIVNIWTNIYIKKLHEHPDLYFVTPR